MLDHKKIEMLRSLATEHNPNPLSGFIQIFLEEAPKYIREIKNAKNHEQVKKPAHTLKSSCENLGLKQLASICKRIEYFGMSLGDLSELSTLIREMDSEFETAKRELESIQ